ALSTRESSTTRRLSLFRARLPSRELLRRRIRIAPAELVARILRRARSLFGVASFTASRLPSRELFRRRIWFAPPVRFACTSARARLVHLPRVQSDVPGVRERDSCVEFVHVHFPRRVVTTASNVYLMPSIGI